MPQADGEARAFRLISKEQVGAAMAAFLMAHPDEICGEAVKVKRLGNLLYCSCKKCDEERTFRVIVKV